VHLGTGAPRTLRAYALRQAELVAFGSDSTTNVLCSAGTVALSALSRCVSAWNDSQRTSARASSELQLAAADVSLVSEFALVPPVKDRLRRGKRFFVSLADMSDVSVNNCGC
jgi:hypothetical protein